MPKSSHYSPALQRFIVCALHHEAKVQGLPMTVLADRLLAQALTGTSSWQKAQAAGHTLQLRDRRNPVKAVPAFT